VPGQHASHLRDYEYKRLGTVSLLAGLDLHTGRIIETVSDTHKERRFHCFSEKVGRTLSRVPKDPLGAGQPFRAYLERDAGLFGHNTSAIRVHTDARLMAESYREPIQQDGTVLPTKPDGGGIDFLEVQMNARWMKYYA
jgi:hypothetical protein